MDPAVSVPSSSGWAWTNMMVDMAASMPVGTDASSTGPRPTIQGPAKLRRPWIVRRGFGGSEEHQIADRDQAGGREDLDRAGVYQHVDPHRVWFAGHLRPLPARKRFVKVVVAYTAPVQAEHSATVGQDHPANADPITVRQGVMLDSLCGQLTDRTLPQPVAVRQRHQVEL